MNDSRWHRYVALGVFLAVVAAAVVFRSRLGADFIPLDSSRVGPNLVASLVQGAFVLIVLSLLYPPARRAVHRFFDRKLERVHESLDAHHEHLEHLAERIEELHDKLDDRA